MKKSLKILSFVISIFIFVSFVGNNRVKAVAAGAVLGAEGISAAVSFLLSTIFTDSLVIAGNAAEQADYTVTVTTDDAQQILDDYFYSFNIDSLDGIDDYNCLMTITDPNQFLSYCGVSDPISLSGAQRTVYSSLQCTHNQVLNRKIITSAKGLVLQPISFSELLNDTSADLISYFSKSEAVVSFQNGLRNISIVDTEDHYFPELCDRFGVVSCIRPYSSLNDYYNTSYYLIRPYSGTHYYVGVMSTNSFCKSSHPFAISYHSPSEVEPKNFSRNDTVLSYAVRMYLDGSRADFFFRSCFLVYSVYSSGGSEYVFYEMDDSNFVSPLDRSFISVYYRGLSLSLDSDYLFEFDSYDNAKAFSDYISGDVGTYNPADDVYTGDDVISVNVPFSDTEKKVGVYEQDHPGVDDIDIVVNPGAVKADDGTITYNPSISVNDTPLDDIDVTGYLDLDDTLDRFQLPSSISTKFPFSLPFDIYNLFNVFSADPVTPKFSVPLDMTSVGGKVYNIDIDLSDFDDIANIVRWLLYGLFLIGLIILTNKLIGRG